VIVSKSTAVNLIRRNKYGAESTRLDSTRLDSRSVVHEPNSDAPCETSGPDALLGEGLLLR
jgi:hypothetical protein